MRVIHIGKFYPPDKGGIETATKSIVEFLWDQDIPCDVVCFSPVKTKKEKGKNGIIHRFQAKLRLLSTPFSLDYLFFLMRRIHHYHVVHLHAPNPLSLFFLFCIRPHQKLIIHWHSDVIAQKRAYTLYRPFEKMMLLRSNLILVGTKEYFQYSEPLRAHIEKVRIIPYAVFDPKSKKISESKTEDINILSVGRLVGYKGFDTLISSAKHLASNIRIIIIGNGPEKKNLQKLIEDNNLNNVEIKDAVEDLEPYFEKAHIFCLPSNSRAESFGISLIEAMSYHLPLLTTDVKGSGMNYININNKTGLIVPPNSPMDLADAINYMASSPDKRKEFSENSYARFKDVFEYEKILPHYLELYR